jgi:RHS repeat-associated protein
LTNDGRWVYTWDAENRLTQMETTPEATTAGHPYTKLKFVNDWQGKRIARTVWQGGTAASPVFKSCNRWLYDGWNVITEFSAPSEYSPALTRLNTFTWGIDLSGTLASPASGQGAGGVGGLLVQTAVSSGVMERASYDGNGNIVAWTKSTATAPTSRREYDAFGNTLVSEGNASSTFGFSTKMQDQETGLYYYGYRYYDAMTGRWPSKDPVGERGGINLYGMCGNDTVLNIDYLGLAIKKKCEFEVVGGHADQVRERENNFDKDKEETPCNRFYGASCFRSPDGGLVWPTPESRDKEGQPGNATMGEELRRKIQQAEGDAPKECADEKTCCSSIKLKVNCRPSPSMQIARNNDPLATRACNYQNNYDCKDKKWSNPVFK